MKNKKNILGTFSPPELSLVDLTFLNTLSHRHIVCGTAESIKMALVCNKELYRLWKDFGVVLQNTRLQYPRDIAQNVIKMSIVDMLNELSKNLYEYDSYKRAVDFGHTFSPYIETSSNYSILHGEAVSIDMAISCQISYLIGYLDKAILEEIISLFRQLNLPVYSAFIDVDKLWSSLDSIVSHRNGALNLVIPTTVGEHSFLETQDFGRTILAESIQRSKDCNV